MGLEFLLGKFHFFTIIFRPDGRRYEGQWRYGKQHGKGKFKDGEGRVVEGVWKDGEKMD